MEDILKAVNREVFNYGGDADGGDMMAMLMVIVVMMACQQITTSHCPTMWEYVRDCESGNFG